MKRDRERERERRSREGERVCVCVCETKIAEERLRYSGHWVSVKRVTRGNHINTTHCAPRQASKPAALTTNACPSTGHVIAQDVCVLVKALCVPSPVMVVAASLPTSTTQPRADQSAALVFAVHTFSVGGAGL